MNYKLKELEWDSEYFGVSSSRVDIIDELTLDDKKSILNYISKYEFITLTNKNNEPEINKWIGSISNSFLVDVNVQFIKKKPTKKIQSEKVILSDGKAYGTQLIKITEETFNYSRFFNDSNLDTFKAKSVYTKWLTSAIGNEGKSFHIYLTQNEVAGFVLSSINESNETVIELIAVDKKYQGQSIGNSLIQAIENETTKKDCISLRVGTQINNVQAINFYHSQGFKYEGCTSIYHSWPTKE